MKAIRPNLIVVSVGIPFDKFLDRYPIVTKENHWRKTNNDRNYDILVLQYGNFEPEEDTYDFLIKRKGYKFEIIKQIISEIDFTQWEYVGFYDDDVIIDYQSVNKSFELAKRKQFPAFQISLDPKCEWQHPVTKNLDGYSYAYTNFIETMCPVISRDYLEVFFKLISAYDIKFSWGVDIVMAEYLNIQPVVIHEIMMHHPIRGSDSYNKKAAFDEMYNVMFNVFPSLMKEKGRDIQTDYRNFKTVNYKLCMTI